MHLHKAVTLLVVLALAGTVQDAAAGFQQNIPWLNTLYNGTCAYSSPYASISQSSTASPKTSADRAMDADCNTCSDTLSPAGGPRQYLLVKLSDTKESLQGVLITSGGLSHATISVATDTASLGKSSSQCVPDFSLSPGVRSYLPCVASGKYIAISSASTAVSVCDLLVNFTVTSEASKHVDAVISGSVNGQEETATIFYQPEGQLPAASSPKKPENATVTVVNPKPASAPTSMPLFGPRAGVHLPAAAHAPTTSPATAPSATIPQAAAPAPFIAASVATPSPAVTHSITPALPLSAAAPSASAPSPAATPSTTPEPALPLSAAAPSPAHTPTIAPLLGRPPVRHTPRVPRPQPSSPAHHRHSHPKPPHVHPVLRAPSAAIAVPAPAPSSEQSTVVQPVKPANGAVNLTLLIHTAPGDTADLLQMETSIRRLVANAANELLDETTIYDITVYHAAAGALPRTQHHRVLAPAPAPEHSLHHQRHAAAPSHATRHSTAPKSAPSRTPTSEANAAAPTLSPVLVNGQRRRALLTAPGDVLAAKTIPENATLVLLVHADQQNLPRVRGALSQAVKDGSLAAHLAQIGIILDSAMVDGQTVIIGKLAVVEPTSPIQAPYPSKSPTIAPSESTSNPASSSSSGLSGGAIAGIAVGAAALVILLILLAVCMMRRNAAQPAKEQVIVPENLHSGDEPSKGAVSADAVNAGPFWRRRNNKLFVPDNKLFVPDVVNSNVPISASGAQ